MVFSYIVSASAGALIGFVTGFIPGVHINLLVTGFVAFSSVLLRVFSPLESGMFLFAMAIAHNFSDNIASMVMGVPASDDVISMLPAHRLLRTGRGREVVFFGMLGMIMSIFCLVLVSPLVFFWVDDVYQWIVPLMPYILVSALGILILREERWLRALLVVGLSGLLGMVVFAMRGLEQPLLPLLSGLFGMSALVESLRAPARIPVQGNARRVNLGKLGLWWSAASALGASLVTCFLPGLSSSHTTLLATSWLGKVREERVIFIANFCNMASMVLSFIALVVIDKARSGVVVGIASFLEVTTVQAVMIVAGALVPLSLVVFACLRGNALVCKVITRVNYRWLAGGVIVLLVGLTAWMSSFVGLLVLACGCAIGICTHFLDVGKNNLMACIIVPVALYLLI